MPAATFPLLPPQSELETRAVLKRLAPAHRYLVELKEGLASTIPNEHILINSLALQEAKDSSEIENIITTQAGRPDVQTYVRGHMMLARFSLLHLMADEIMTDLLLGPNRPCQSAYAPRGKGACAGSEGHRFTAIFQQVGCTTLA